MPISKSAKKSLRVSRTKYAHNVSLRKTLKEKIKKVSEKTINVTFSLIDKAAKNNLIHPNKAARLKSRLAKKIGKTPKVTETKEHKNPSKILPREYPLENTRGKSGQVGAGKETKKSTKVAKNTSKK